MKGILKLGLVLLIVVGVLYLAGDFLTQKTGDFLNLKKPIEHKRPNDGLFKEYYEDGQLKSEEYYEDGQKVGTWKRYHQNGKLQSIQSYYKNQLDGLTAHYDTCETLIFTEFFDQGICKKREIVNDSLYKFQIRILPHGAEVFEEHCKDCHSVRENLAFPRDSIEGNGLTFIHMDSIHLKIFKKSFLDSLQETKPYSDTIPLDTYDIEALQLFLENLSTKNNVKIVKPKVLKIKGKTS